LAGCSRSTVTVAGADKHSPVLRGGDLIDTAVLRLLRLPARYGW